MTDINPESPRRLSDSDTTSPADVLVSLLKAGLATTPFAGGLASLLSDYIPTARMRRLESFVEQLAGDLARLQSQVNPERFQTDEYAFLVERCLRGVTENYQAEKLTAFRGVLVNSAIGDGFADEEREYFVNLVGTLSVLHMRILWFLDDPEAYIQQYGIPADTIRGGFGQFMPAAIPGVSGASIKSAFGDLYRYGLINTEASIFGTMTAGQGVEFARGRVTEHGRSFVAFCSVPEN